MRSYHRKLFAVLCCVALSFSVSGPTSSETLLSHIKNLHCAPDSKTAANYIRNIQRVTLFPPGLPNETNDAQNPALRAATLDRLLTTLYASSQKYPTNKDLIEEAVIQWNFCSVIDNGQLYDHTIGQRTVSPSSHSQQHWAGFKSFGLVNTSDTADRFDFTTPYKDSLIRPLADIKLLETYIKHCLPHPDDEHLYRSFGRNFISRLIPASKRQKDITTSRQAFECTPLQTAPVPPPSPELTPVAPPPAAPAAPATDESEHAVEPEEQTVPLSITERPAPLEISAPVESIDPLKDRADVIEEAAKPVVAAAKPVTDDLSNSVIITDSKPFETTKQTSSPVPKNSIPIKIKTIQTLEKTTVDFDPPAAVVVIGPANGGSVASTNINNSKGFSGSITLENKSFQADQTSLKLAFAYKPIQDSYWFLRSAFNISNQSNPVTYSWGIGYDDWHSGTWGIQLNHWGPLSSGDGLDIDNAVIETSYKIKSSWLEKNNLGSSIALSSPISGKPSLSWGWSWSPFSDWFVRTTFIKPTSGGGLDWSYGFGFTRYTPSSLSVEYNNWGVNHFPNANFKGNGQLSLIYRWAF